MRVRDARVSRAVLFTKGGRKPGQSSRSQKARISRLFPFARAGQLPSSAVANC